MPILRVSAGVLTKGSQVLICQRRSQDLHPGKWEFPGGKVKDGEDGAACLWRELREELRIDATIGAEIHNTSTFKRTHRHAPILSCPFISRRYCQHPVSGAGVGEVTTFPLTIFSKVMSTLSLRSRAVMGAFF
jgi:8-oxo-dGTP pyrophosphatase MutT (NUDIX family)